MPALRADTATLCRLASCCAARLPPGKGPVLAVAWGLGTPGKVQSQRPGVHRPYSEILAHGQPVSLPFMTWGYRSLRWSARAKEL